MLGHNTINVHEFLTDCVYRLLKANNFVHNYCNTLCAWNVVIYHMILTNWSCPSIMLTLSDSSTTALSVHKVMFMCMLTDILSYMAVTVLIMSTVFVVSLCYSLNHGHYTVGVLQVMLIYLLYVGSAHPVPEDVTVLV